MSIDEAIRQAVADAIKPLQAQLAEVIRAVHLKPDPDRKLTGREATRAGKCRSSDLYRAARSGELPAEYRPGGRGSRGLWLFRRADVEAWAANRRGQPPRDRIANHQFQASA